MLRVVLNREALEKAMARHNLTHKELAARIGMSRSYLSKAVWGKSEIPATLRQRLLQYFQEYTFDDLFTIEENAEAGASPAPIHQEPGRRPASRIHPGENRDPGTGRRLNPPLQQNSLGSG